MHLVVSIQLPLDVILESRQLMNKSLTFTFCAWAAFSTHSSALLLFSDNFNAPNNSSLDLSDQTGRRAGLNSLIQIRSARIQHEISGNQLLIKNGGTGRIRFHDDADDDNTTAGVVLDWATGVVGSQMLTDGGLRISFKWTPTVTDAPQWITVNVGHGGPDDPIPGFRVNNSQTDCGLLFRLDGRTELWDNAGNRGAQGSFDVSTIATREIVLDYAFDSFADGTNVTLNATVDGSSVLADYIFQWEGNNGKLYLTLGTNINTNDQLIDDLVFETPGVSTYSLALDGTEFFSSEPQGALIGNLAGTGDAGQVPSTFMFVTGDGDDDNAKFQITDGKLEVGGFDFLNEPDGTEYSVRVEGTNTDTNEKAEGSFIVTVTADADSDNIPDVYELSEVTLLTELNGNASGPGPGTGSGDFDGDGLSDFDEWQLSLDEHPGISPADADSDDDELSDGDEVDGAGDRGPTNPVNADSDGDSLSDKVESNSGSFVDANDTGSDPLLADTDSDGYRDGFEVLRGGDPTDIASRPPFSPGVSMTLLTDDASTGVSIDKTYTHAVSGGGAAELNGVNFVALLPLSEPNDLLWDTGEYTKNAIAPVNNGGWLPGDGGVTGAMLTEMLGSFTFSGSGDRLERQQTYTLGGLSPGQDYTLKIFVRTWALNGSGRPMDLRLINGDEISYAPILQDRPHLTFPNDLSITEHSAYTLDFEYVAAGTELVIEAQIPPGSAAPSGSMHLYALTNEVSFGSEAPEITSIVFDESGPRTTFEFTSVPGASYLIESSSDLVNWLELEDEYESEGTSTSYTSTFFSDGSARQYYRVTKVVQAP